MNVIGFEAKCRKCREAFSPADENDLTHLERLDGQECGGQGELVGGWVGRLPTARLVVAGNE